jgi:hypothetical protein
MSLYVSIYSSGSMCVLHASHKFQNYGHVLDGFALCYKLEGCGFDSRWCYWNFSLTYPSGCTMALGLAQPLTEMSTRDISWV